jgi:hypothetical protein
MQEEVDRKRTLVSGRFKVKLQVLLPREVEPLYVVQVIVQVPDSSFRAPGKRRRPAD